MKSVLLAVSALIFVPLTATASEQPYGDFDTREIKSLSAKQIDDLRAGRGMGLALPAELNGYPGPTHVLENADALALSGSQRQQVRALFEAMKAEAMPLGEDIIRQEIALNRMFATKAAEAPKLEAATSSIGAAQGALRAAHLRYHLAMLDILTPEQIEKYRQLRGYASPDQHHPGAH